MAKKRASARRVGVTRTDRNHNHIVVFSLRAVSQDSFTLEIETEKESRTVASYTNLDSCLALASAKLRGHKAVPQSWLEDDLLPAARLAARIS